MNTDKAQFVRFMFSLMITRIDAILF